MAVLEAFFRTQCDIIDPCRRPRIDHGRPSTFDDAVYDFIVIGAGAAGAAVASRLSANKAYQVLLIEAGGQELVARQVPAFFRIYLRSPVDWQYKTQRNQHSFMGNRTQTMVRGKSLGGSTAINGMLYMRGTRDDYDAWERLGNRGWRYDDVMPYFLRAEDHQQIDQVGRLYHATGGPVAVSEYPYASQTVKDFMRAANQCGFGQHDLNGANSTGAMFSQSTMLNGVRVSTSRAYLHPARNRRNLHIRLYTQATRVLIDEQTKRAYGVETVDQDGQRQRWLVRREVIVSCGTIESPKLLMHSGIGPADHLQQFGIRPIVDRRGVGENLQNHVGLRLRIQSTNRTQAMINWAMATEYLLTRGGPLSTLGSLLHVRFSSPAALAAGESNDVQLCLTDDFTKLANVCSKTGAIDLEHESPLMMTVWSVCVRPRSRGRIRLQSADPLQPPMVWPNDLADGRDVEVILAGVQSVLRIVGTQALAEYGLVVQRGGGRACAGFAWLSSDYWRCVIRHDTTEYSHQVGTCKMAPPEDDGRVVDAELRVYGVAGLRVIDASVMPLVVAGNTMATVTMIGEKGAQSILETWSV